MQTAKAQRVDFLVLGSGIAGMRAAIGLAGVGRVLILSKGSPGESNSQYAQGGVAAAVSEDDEVGLHLYDTLVAGDGLCREAAVRTLAEDGPGQIHQLVDWGMRFDRDGARLALAREGAHSRSRVLHAQGDSTGSEILRVLTARARSLPGVEIRPYALGVDFLVHDGCVWGVHYFDEKEGVTKNVIAGATLLATGGLGQAYSETTNPPVASGDGVAMAYRAGAVLSDMEFVQFHPTALYVKGKPRFLLSEALRGEGAYLRNILLERFMPRYHEAAELAPRDVVSRAIVMETQKCRSDFVYLDLTGLDPERVKRRFPRIFATCLEYNLDITTDLVPVYPAAHYAIGGVSTDLDGATTLKGLYAAGEVAATGVHGANRLASNSLLECLVFGARAAQAMVSGRLSDVSRAERAEPELARDSQSKGSPPKSTLDPAELEKMVHSARCELWEKVGIIRHGKELREAVKHFESIPFPRAPAPSRRHHEAQNILDVAGLIARCALARKESRGSHYRADFPLKSPTLAQHSVVSKDSPVSFESG